MSLSRVKRNLASKQWIGLPLAALISFALSGCYVMETHESAPQYSYHEIQTGNGGAYQTVSQEPHYRGTHEGKAHFDHSVANPANASYARGVFNFSPGNEGYYGAAFYFPVGTFTGGSLAKQDGRIDIMGWSNDSGDYGGISIDPDHMARLVRGTATQREPIGDPFKLREGCWNWLTVHQKGSATDGPAVSELYLNGRKLVTSTKANSFGNPASHYRFGLVSTSPSARQTNDLDVYVDDAYISDNGSGIVQPQGNACRPNILFIVSDDQRADTVNPTWMPKTLNNWFNNTSGVDPSDTTTTNFTQAYDTSPLCCPSRASIMTGRYSHNTRVWQDGNQNLLGPSNLDTNTTVQHNLRQAGYHTAILGKYLYGWPADQGNPPNPPGPPDFDQWTIYDNGMHYDKLAYGCDRPGLPPAPGQGVECVNDNGTLGEIPRDEYETTYLADKAKSFIDTRASSPTTPWMLYLTPTIPHPPYDVELNYSDLPVNADANESNAPEADVTDKPPLIQQAKNGKPDGDLTLSAAGFKAGDDNSFPTGGTRIGTFPPGGSSVRCPNDSMVLPNGIPGWTKCLLDYIRPAQLRMLRSLDDMINSVLNELKQTNQLDDTLVVFISDNGFMWNEHALSGKPYQYLENVQTPLLIRWPNHHMSTSTDSYLAGNIDLAPTALAAARVPIPETVDGRDLLAPDRPPRDHLFLEMRPWASLVKSNLQYIESYQPGTYTPVNWGTPYGLNPQTGQPFRDSGPQADVREYYQLKDSLGLDRDRRELVNLLHDDNLPDPPEVTISGGLHDQLVNDRTCRGHGIPNYPACP